MSDKELIYSIRKGDRKAFKQLVVDYQKMVINTCNGFLHNISDAEDISQEVFTEVFLSAHKFRGDSKISTWLYRIAVNKSLNFLRDNKNEKRIRSIEAYSYYESSGEINIAVPESDNVESLVENSEQRKNLFLAISSLPENQKTAFVLSKYEDLSYKDISEVMNITIPSVESLLFRAKKNLQKKLIECYKKLNA